MNHHEKHSISINPIYLKFPNEIKMLFGKASIDITYSFIPIRTITSNPFF